MSVVFDQQRKATWPVFGSSRIIDPDVADIPRRKRKPKAGVNPVPFVPRSIPDLTPLSIMTTVCAWHGVTFEQFRSSTKKPEVVAARHEAYFLCCLLTPYPISAIADVACKNAGNVGITLQRYTGPDRSNYLIAGTMPPGSGQAKIPVNARYCRAYMERLRASGKYEAYLERKRQKHRARAAEKVAR